MAVDVVDVLGIVISTYDEYDSLEKVQEQAGVIGQILAEIGLRQIPVLVSNSSNFLSIHASSWCT